MGTGEATGEDRAIQAAEKAIANPLLDEISLHGARGVLINITGGYDLTLFELDEAANRIREKVDPEANIIVGSTLDPEMEGAIRVSVVATGIDASPTAHEMDVPRRKMTEPIRPDLPERPAAASVAPERQAEPEYEDIEEPVFVPRNDERAREQAQANLFADQQEAAHEASRAPVYAQQAARSQPPHQQQPAPMRFRQEQPQAPAARHADRNFDLDEVLHKAPQHPAQPAHGDAGNFVAPRRGSAGTPSPETLARLQAAVRKAPGAQPHSQPAPQPEAERPAASGRFGIGSLISRMSGQGAENTARMPRTQPPVTAHDDDPGVSAEQERIEIPAFLRRQAN